MFDTTKTKCKIFFKKMHFPRMIKPLVFFCYPQIVERKEYPTRNMNMQIPAVRVTWETR